MTRQARQNPTINDVAKAAGVSRATASRAVGGYGRINAETIKKVMEVAQELGYRPNQVARAMRAGTTRTIGLVIIADFTNAFFDRATKGIVDRARANGYQVLIANTDEDIEQERQAVETLIEKQVDGLIVVASTPQPVRHLTEATLRGRPLVLIDRRVEGLESSTVTTDDLTGASESVTEVIKRGHRSLGFLIASTHASANSSQTPTTMISTVRDRVAGFKNGLKSATVDSLASHWRFVKDLPDDAHTAVLELLDSTPTPTVIFASNNDMALAVLTVARERNLRIGQDLSLITVDDSPWAQAMAPGIAVVARPVEELATMAVNQLLQEIAEPTTNKVSVVLPTTVIMRDSVATLAP
jgi:LacI family transcriptional regulator